MQLLEDILVIDFSQFLSGPSASLRLADLGAEVIKIEKRDTGDICRHLYVSDIVLEGESTIFHAINRNKESYAADLKDELDIAKVKKLMANADVVMHNFRPGVMQRLGLDYETVKDLNPSVVYAEISGYGNEGDWKSLPGQDLLLQAASGLTWLSNNQDEQPTPMGVAVVDILAGTHITQGILASLYKRAITGEGALVQVSMLESILDFQFEVLTCYYNDGNQLPVRSAINAGHVYVAAPYGIYQTSSSYLALAMGSITTLANLLQCPALKTYTDSSQWFTLRDEIKHIIALQLITRTTEEWLAILEPADIWCAKVLDYEALMQEQAYQLLEMEMTVTTSSGLSVTTTRCPLRVDKQRLTSTKGAPQLGEHNQYIDTRFDLIEEPVLVGKQVKSL